MQKKIIALAIAGLASSAAFAQTNVTVYGVADIGQTYVAVSGNGTAKASALRQDSNSSYIGFKGVEDLGNGLKAVFQFETGYSPDSGAGFGASRDSFVGLAGGFGTVALGTLTHPLRNMGSKVELMPGAAGLGTTASVTGRLLGQATGADDRARNAVAYISPVFVGGLTVTGAFVNGLSTSADESRAANGVNMHAYQLAAQYDANNLYVGLGYHVATDVGATVTTSPALGAALGASNGDKARVIRAAAAYTFPSLTKVTALWDNTRVGNAADGSSASRNAYSLGVSQGFGKNTVGVEYGFSSKVKADGDTVDDTGSSIVSAIYSYELSKRTMIHARASRLNNSANNSNQFYNNSVSSNITNATANGADFTGVMVGLRHTF